MATQQVCIVSIHTQMAYVHLNEFKYIYALKQAIALVRWYIDTASSSAQSTHIIILGQKPCILVVLHSFVS